MHRSRQGISRLALASGGLLAVGALATVAAVVDYADVYVELDADRNGFDIRVAGSTEPGWEPTDESWDQGSPDAYEVALDAGTALAPGGSLALRIAVHNSSQRLPALLSLTIRDPSPRGLATDPATGRYRELFDQAVFTVSEGGERLLDRVPAHALETYTWPMPLAADAQVVLDVEIGLPESVDNRWQEATTTVQFHFTAENS
ncbi:hypothetical protein [Microbacterium sp. SORGH_AS_0888]|uniref:hypothetical protein n=1 Tax=Microbacterium sp. SORGH_AS_0888 TaxID=3041791 RepID=UPI002781CAE9|nr:hypothetical protein [Microbacterium sp. SORGH_AS_0888]MDQ1129990.1 hypothetical protein [Microbacterium sp. SORGH_AS_0888]